LIKKPAVLLLDEATSALDATSEKLVQQSIDDLQKEKAQTTIIIAHRLSTIRNADKICVVSEGRVVELGKHDELVAKKGAYYDLIQLQVNDNPIEQSSSTSDLTLLVENSTARAAANVTKEDKIAEEKVKVDEIVPDKKVNDRGYHHHYRYRHYHYHHHYYHSVEDRLASQRMAFLCSDRRIDVWRRIPCLGVIVINGIAIVLSGNLQWC